MNKKSILKNNLGWYSLILVCVAVAIILPFFGRKTATNNATNWTDKMALDRDISKSIAINCSIFSTTEDGRVSCDVVYIDKNNQTVTRNLRCDTFPFGTCKTAVNVFSN